MILGHKEKLKKLYWYIANIPVVQDSGRRYDDPNAMFSVRSDKWQVQGLSE